VGISKAELVAATGMAPERAAAWLPHIQAVVEKYELSAPRRLAMWLAQCGHESGGFRRLEENLNYSAAALARTWPARFLSVPEAEEYARQPERIANKVYGGRMGNASPGDGWRFRGRGLIQLTGRDNYQACGAALGLDLLASPEVLATAPCAALSAGWFWHTRDLNALADAGNVAGVTREINGGTLGLAERAALYERALAALQVAVPPPDHPEVA
jgi:putative chitinase